MISMWHSSLYPIKYSIKIKLNPIICVEHFIININNRLFITCLFSVTIWWPTLPICFSGSYISIDRAWWWVRCFDRNTGLRLNRTRIKVWPSRRVRKKCVKTRLTRISIWNRNSWFWSSTRCILNTKNSSQEVSKSDSLSAFLLLGAWLTFLSDNKESSSSEDRGITEKGRSMLLCSVFFFLFCFVLFYFCVCVCVCVYLSLTLS